MRRCLGIAASLIVASSAAALADGMHSRSAYCCAPFSWTGFYIGAHGGWYQARTDAAYHVDDVPGDPSNNFIHDSFRLNGGIFGGHIGYNLQASNVVVGVEADYSGTSNGDNKHTTFALTDPGEGDALSTQARLHSVATVRGRLGVATKGPTPNRQRAEWRY